jgi:histidyl-tRNA synthetase
MTIIQAIRGMNDVLPDQTEYWRYLETKLHALAAMYGYRQIILPLVENTALFERSIGEATDIVEKEMYTFLDRNGESLTLRPEGTAGCVRACIQHGLLHNQQQRLWYFGPMFRYERPQKGRYRQFYQFGLEALGMPGPDVDAEQLLMMARLWKELGIQDHVRLQINSLGTNASRLHYRKQLVDYFSAHREHLDEDSLRRLNSNPLRILDSKNPAMQSLIANAPVLIDHLDEDSLKQFEKLKRLLETNNIPYEINPRLVRGLDYYCHLVFEWVTDLLGSQNAICSGGRYDCLTELLGGKPTSAVGLSMGIERVIALLQSVATLPNPVDAYFILMGEAAEEKGLILAEQLRTLLAGLRLQVNCDGGSFKTQFKRADKSGASIALILGADELEQNLISVKFLRQDKPQMQLKFDEIVKLLGENL